MIDDSASKAEAFCWEATERQAPLSESEQAQIISIFTSERANTNRNRELFYAAYRALAYLIPENHLATSAVQKWWETAIACGSDDEKSSLNDMLGGIGTSLYVRMEKQDRRIDLIKDSPAYGSYRHLLLSLLTGTSADLASQACDMLIKLPVQDLEIEQAVAKLFLNPNAVQGAGPRMDSRTRDVLAHRAQEAFCKLECRSHTTIATAIAGLQAYGGKHEMDSVVNLITTTESAVMLPYADKLRAVTSTLRNRSAGYSDQYVEKIKAKLEEYLASFPVEHGAATHADRESVAVLETPVTEEVLIESLEAGEVESLKQALKSNPQCVRGFFGNGGWTLLEIAAGVRNMGALQLLINAGADVNARGKDNRRTPLMRAAELAFMSIKQRTKSGLAAIRLLLNAGANVNASDDFGITALHIASDEMHDKEGNTKDVISTLLQNGADVNARDYRGLTPFAIVCKDAACFEFQPDKRLVEIAELLIANGTDTQAVANDGTLPFEQCRSSEGAFRAALAQARPKDQRSRSTKRQEVLSEHITKAIAGAEKSRSSEESAKSENRKARITLFTGICFLLISWCIWKFLPDAKTPIGRGAKLGMVLALTLAGVGLLLRTFFGKIRRKR